VLVVLQRVLHASVAVEHEVIGRIGPGLVALVGVAAGDGPADIEYIASKICDVRIFDDDRGRLNRSVRDVGGALLVISQFTLLGDVRQGRRPAFDTAEAPDAARQVYGSLLAALATRGVPVESGRFQAHMQVELVNDGPVTILLDSRKGRVS
jgi:D-tyrosyl-tRNA(Tyr) deacylase